MVLELLGGYETERDDLLQFQFLEENELNQNLGPTHCGYLHVETSVLGIRTLKKRWLCLKGTSLFFFKDERGRVTLFSKRVRSFCCAR